MVTHFTVTMQISVIRVTNCQMPGARVDPPLGWSRWNILVHTCSFLLCCSPLPRVMSVDTKSIHATEIQGRPPRTWRQTAHAILYFFVFNLGCIAINVSQFVFLLPLRFLPFAPAKSLYDAGIRLSEGAFGTLLSKCLSPLLHSFH